LDVALSPTTDPFLVAQFMARFFPNLTKIYTFDESRWNAGGFFSTNYLGDQEIAEHPTEYALFHSEGGGRNAPKFEGCSKIMGAGASTTTHACFQPQLRLIDSLGLTYLLKYI
jgi:hypothetical protein